MRCSHCGREMKPTVLLSETTDQQYQGFVCIYCQLLQSNEDKKKTEYVVRGHGESGADNSGFSNQDGFLP